MGWLDLLSEGFDSPALSVFLIIVILLLLVVVLYFLIKEFLVFVDKLKKKYEAKEIVELKEKEKRLLSKLRKDKKEVSQKIEKLSRK